MNLIDRVIEFNDWPTNRKSLLLMAVAMIFHLLLAPVAYYFSVSAGAVDAQLMLICELAGLLAVFLCLCLSFISTKSKGSGRWTAYLIFVVYGGWILLMCYLYGVWDSPYIAWLPGVLPLLALWYDEEIAIWGIAYNILGLLALVALVLNDILPLAPLLSSREIDARATASWAISILAPVSGVIAFAFIMSLLAVLTRKRQALKLERAQLLIHRYVPRQVTEQILNEGDTEGFQPQRKKLTIFFSDIEGFTQASDHLDPEELASVLDQYLSEMAEIASRYGATINQFVGDGIMLFFGAPEATDDRDHAVRCVRMALEMQERMQGLNDVWVEHGIRAPFRVRMGINTGYSSVGDFGSSERKEYTAIGIQTNLAARIQSHCEPGKVLITDTTYALVKDTFECQYKGEYELKGIHFPVKAYEVTGRK